MTRLPATIPVTMLMLVSFAAPFAHAATDDLGNGFLHHGVATPVSNHRGIVCTIDGQGRNVVLVWLFDHRGGYALLMIDAESGMSREIPMPFAPGGDCPYSSILSSANKYYTHFNSHFVEFDPIKGQFTFCHQTAPQMAMSMTEDDRGVIWSVTYPHSGLVSYDPATGTFKDYGHLHQENWLQYPRYIAADDQGWIYFGIGSTLSHILAFDPRAGQVREVVPAQERAQGEGYVYRDLNGKVYGHPPGENNWYCFHGGTAVKIGDRPTINRKPIISDTQGLFHGEFPNGNRLTDCDLVNRVMTVVNSQTGETKALSFAYTSEGAHIMGLAAAPDGTICGGTAFPMRFFSYNPERDQWTNRASYSQWNTVARQGDHFFVGGYPAGFLLDWDPARPWVPTEIDKPESNPQFLTQCTPAIYRPHSLLAHPDGKTLVLGGTPGYGYTGGGLLFWDRPSARRVLLEHTDVIPDHSTAALVALEGGKLLGGTTTAPGTGGEKKAQQAELYILDMETKKLEWHAAVFPGVQGYTALWPGPNGTAYGIADHARWFVFDPAARTVVHDELVSATFGPTVGHQGPRVFVTDDQGTTYLLFVKGIARIDPQTHAITLLADSPVPIAAGGDILDGRIFFASGSHLYSWALPRP
ncbi:MAG: NHL repeat-containing protein [Pirellulaceae bacterium]